MYLTPTTDLSFHVSWKALKTFASSYEITPLAWMMRLSPLIS